MASPAADIGQSHQHHPASDSAADSAFQEAQTWIEAVTGRCFGDRDFRGGLENGILLCELLSSIKPGLVKKINRLPTPIAGLDNLSVFLRGCEELGLKGSQLFDPGDLQDTSTRPIAKGSDCSRKLKNVLITIYWLGRAANGCTSYNGPTLDLKEFEGLLSQMRKEAEEAESPKRSIRDSGYIDCWDSERSDSLSPPRHGREDSFDSLDSFGSRSRQTPSPDVLVARGSSDGRGSDSESDGTPHRKVPDIRKDDMSARRTSVSELRTAMPFNQYLPNKSNQSGYVPTPLRKKKNDKEEGARKSWSTATSPIGGDRPFSTPARSCSEELFHLSTTLAGNTVVASVVATGPGKHSPATDREEAGVSKGPAGAPLACQTLTSLKRTPSPSHLLPVPAATATTSKEIANTGRRKGRALSESDDPQGSWFDGNLPATFSHTDIVSDDSQSVSMIDMRGEDEGILQPHSQVRHELMHNQYNMMKEEEDHWQDDLARWKNRRRSVSQDLIKKEEERKMMENLLTGDVCPAQRRRSIKTYREIVEEKERREEDLRDTYRRARTPEEASVILQRYAQRFSISETILERLQLPQLLDRSISADPSFACSPFPLSLSSSPTTPDPFDVDPNGPLRFLRQQSAPAPKFTSTLEARIEEFPKDLSSPHQRPQIRSRSSEPPSTRALSPKPVPLLTPKPYFESRGRAAEPWANKADGLLRVNGNAGSDAPTAPESRGTESPPHFQASPSRTSHSTVAAPCSAASPAHSPHASPAGGSPASIKAKEARGGTRAASEDVREQRGAEHSSPLSRPTSLPAELQKSEESFWKTGDQTAAGPEEKTSNAAAQPTTRTEAKQEVKPEASGPNVATLVQSGLSTQQCHTVTLQASFPSSQEFSQGGENVPNLTAPGSSGYHPAQELTAEFANSVISPPATSNPKLRWEFFAPPEAPEKDLRGNVSVPVLPQARRADRWSWDPDEERKRQERWQQEQERMLQEKYRREQEKLKEEWEKAQREVAEEERKYHEEERRILEETAAPLTPRSSALPSPSRGELSSTAEPHDTIVRSLADWERKQELLERQSRGSTESAEGKRRENDRTSDISTADDSMKTGRSLVSHSSSQPETLGHSLQNGQKPPATLKPSTPVKKQEDLTTDGNKAGQSAGDRRGGPIDNNTSRSSSKPPAACPPPPDTLPPAPNRSVSGKKLCSSCGQPLGKGAAMIIETLSLYFHIHCFKCGVCKGQLGDTTTGTDVRIRNGLLNCHQCYIRSRSAGQPTTL
ncbi:LIM and calponin homology domains-containing protein 1-like isoform X9 [Hippoglossus hippoglossus]|uniref:LIM and calponin homology domains-containing protein 1-like isoform X9 n=1 Tax=Hippoglossus hippoglossus TaxID=8267 RepID=UPI00148BF102|nr:LIM and calponin homology domains-containing protein 1-like isoform X9 [Hippoglossus hippoglossus]